MVKGLMYYVCILQIMLGGSLVFKAHKEPTTTWIILTLLVGMFNVYVGAKNLKSTR